jgi:hypothetical protein
MGILDALFGQVSQAITNHSSPDTPGPAYDPSDLLSQLSNVFGQQAAANNEEFSGYGNVRPASEDPYGDPADTEQGQFGNVLPASQDPYGDPADQSQFGNVRPASEDPYGDPADQR